MKILLRLFAVLLLCAPAWGGEQEKKKYKALYITQSKGFRHGSVNRKDRPLAPSEVALTEIGKESGLFDVECTQDASVLTAEKLRGLDLVMFYTTGQLPIDEKNWGAFDAWLKSGKAMVGFHSATDTFKNFAPYHTLINGTFAGHPWGSGSMVSIAVHDQGHGAVKTLGSEFEFKDEIYQYRNYDPAAVRVLYSLDMARTQKKAPYHVPVCWVREFGKGRMFYTNLGHNEGSWRNPKFREHALAGIRWALGLEEGAAEPNPDEQAVQDIRSYVAFRASQEKKDPVALAARAEKYARDHAAWLGKYVKTVAGLRDSVRKGAKERTALLEALWGELSKS